MGVPVGTEFSYDDAADLVNVIKGFLETGQAIGILTGQELSGSLPLRLNGVITGTTHLGKELERLADAGILKGARGERALRDCPGSLLCSSS